VALRDSGRSSRCEMHDASRDCSAAGVPACSSNWARKRSRAVAWAPVRAEDRHLCRRGLRDVTHSREETHGRLDSRSLGSNQGQSGKRRPTRYFPLAQGSGCECAVAAGQQLLQQRVFRILTLNEDFTRPRSATGTPGHLDDRLRQTLAGAEVGTEEPWSAFITMTSVTSGK